MTSPPETDVMLPATIKACLFDMDGVLTATATVHAAAWKAMFDAFLQQRAEKQGTEFVPFDIATDYVKYVDGKLRQDGVRAFLASRDITLPEGSADDDESAETVHGLGNRKNGRVVELIRTQGVETYPDAIDFLQRVRAAGLLTAVVSASKNTPEVLHVTGLEDMFDVVMHGGIAGQMHLAGKPAPDTFLAAADMLGVEAEHAAVLEDAQAGVQAGRNGGFGFVIGVNRVDQRDALIAHGATVVLDDLHHLHLKAE